MAQQYALAVNQTRIERCGPTNRALCEAAIETILHRIPHARMRSVWHTSQGAWAVYCQALELVSSNEVVVHAIGCLHECRTHEELELHSSKLLRECNEDTVNNVLTTKQRY